MLLQLLCSLGFILGKAILALSLIRDMTLRCAYVFAFDMMQSWLPRHTIMFHDHRFNLWVVVFLDNC